LGEQLGRHLCSFNPSRLSQIYPKSLPQGLRRLFRMAAADEIDVVLVEFKDRLARFGFAGSKRWRHTASAPRS